MYQSGNVIASMQHWQNTLFICEIVLFFLKSLNPVYKPYHGVVNIKVNENTYSSR